MKSKGYKVVSSGPVKSRLVITVMRFLREIRQSKGFTQEEMARHLGLGYSTYLNLEKKGNNPRLSTLKKIREQLNISWADFGKYLDATKSTIILVLALFSSYAEAKTICFGDSVTFGVGVESPDRTFCEMVGGINKGVPSEDTREALVRFRNDVLSERPDLVIIMFGLNDSLSLALSDYRANLRYMIMKLQRRGVSIILLTPNATARPWMEELTGPYVRTVRRLGERLGVPVVDVHRAFKRSEDIRLLLDADEAHPNGDGHGVIYKQIKAIK